MRRAAKATAVVAAGAAALALAGPAAGAGCTAAPDPAGDARVLPGDVPAEHDLVALRAYASSPLAAVFEHTLAAPAPKAVPGRWFNWYTVVELSDGGSAPLFAVRDARGDHGTATLFDRSGRVVGTHELGAVVDDRARTVSVKLPYRLAGLRDGTRITAVAGQVSSGVGSTVAVPGPVQAWPPGASIHVHLADEVQGSTSVVAGRGC